MNEHRRLAGSCMSVNRLRRSIPIAVFVGILAGMCWLTMSARAQQDIAALEVPSNVAAHPAPEQPIAYSHRLHLALGLTCDTCHTGGTSEAQMGLPPTATCMSCHSAIATDRPAIQRLTAFDAAHETVPWARVYQVLPGVTWSHEPHLAAGVDCEACHGRVAALDAMQMTTGVTAMASCIGCHESRSVRTDCTTCHAWPPATSSP